MAARRRRLDRAFRRRPGRIHCSDPPSAHVPFEAVGLPALNGASHRGERRRGGDRRAGATSRIERFRALAFSCGAKAWLILTKADLVEADRADALAAEPGAKVDEAFCVSSEDPSSIAAVRDAWMPGETPSSSEGPAQERPP